MSSGEGGVRYVRFQIQHSVLELVSQRSFEAGITLAKLKELLHRAVGTPIEWMRIEFRDGATGQVLFDVPRDSPIVGTTTIADVLKPYEHLVDTTTSEGEVLPAFVLFVADEDPEKTVEKSTRVAEGEAEPHFKLSAEAYNQREDTLKAWREKTLAKLTESIGRPCKVNVKDQPQRVGTIRYVGPLDGHPGNFVGVEFEEPLGKNDGSLGGKRYFEAKPNHGSFVKPELVVVEE